MELQAIGGVTNRGGNWPRSGTPLCILVLDTQLACKSLQIDGTPLS